MNKVVITGIGIVSPVGLDKESTWKNLEILSFLYSGK